MVKCVRGEWAKSRSRFPQVSLRRAKPKGASSGSGAKNMRSRQGLSKGKNPGTAAGRAGISVKRGDQRSEKR